MSKITKSLSPLQVSPQAVLKIDKPERTRAAILNSALDFIWAHPFRDMTVKSIMAATNVSRSAFYLYFKDLHEVMEILLDTVTLFINGEKVGESKVERTQPGMFSISETFDVGVDMGTPVSNDYTRTNGNDIRDHITKVIVTMDD